MARNRTNRGTICRTVESLEHRTLLAVNPFGLTETGRFGGSALDVAAAGQYAYVANGRVLNVLNISNPASPTLASKLKMPDAVRAVTVSGNFAYCACGESGLQIVNISNAAAPTIVGAFDDHAISLDVVVQGNYAYVADYFYLDVINISNPAAPVLSGRAQPSSPNSYQLRSVAISGTTAILGDENYGLRTFSIASPTNPIHRGGYQTPGGVNYGVAFAPQAGYALLGNSSDGMDIISLASLTSPTKVASRYLSTAREMQVIGTRAYVASSVYGLQVVELSNISNPSLVTTLSNVARTTSLSILNGQAWLASATEGLYVTPIATPTVITSVPLIVSTGFVRSSTVVGNRLYQLAESGLEVIDVSDPADPRRLGRDFLGNIGYDIAVSGNYAYIAYGDIGVVIYNVSNPASPTYVNYYVTPGPAYGLALQGQRLYVGAGSAGLVVLSIASPTALTVLGSVDTPGTASAVSVSNNIAAVADGGTVKLIDCTNVSAPQIRSTLSASYYTNVAIAGTTLYTTGLTVSAFNLANPASPVLLGSAPALTELSFDLAVSGSQLLTVTDDGMDVFSIRTPSSITLMQSVHGASAVGSITYGLSVNGDYAYLANNESGLRVIRIDRPAPTVLTKTYKDDSGQSIEFLFDQDVQASVGGNDLTLFNQTNGQTYSGGLLVLTTGAAGTLARWKPFPAALLPDGNYVATINANAIENTIGTTLASQVQFNFTVLRGDVNHDRTVNFDDLLILAQNYGLSGRTFSQGNTDYSSDGVVGFEDLLLLAQRYGTSLVSASPIGRSSIQSKVRRGAGDVLA